MTAKLNNAKLINMLRSNYRALWDAHQIIADANARLVHSGERPSDERLIKEQKAAEAVQLARAELLATISRVDAD